MYSRERHRAADLRSELFKLKQQLDREQFERRALEEQLAQLAGKPPAAAAAATPTATSSAPAAVLENSARVRELEAEVASLKQSLLARSSAPSTTSTSATAGSNSTEVKQLQQRIAALEKEVAQLHAQYREALDRQSRMAQECQSLQQQVAKWKDQCDRMQQLQRQSSVSLATEQQPSAPNMRTASFCAASSPSLPTAAGSSSRLFLKNYFILANESDAAELARVERTLTEILNSSSQVDFSEVTELNEFFKLDSGRRRFTQMLESRLKEVCSRASDCASDCTPLTTCSLTPNRPRRDLCYRKTVSSCCCTSSTRR